MAGQGIPFDAQAKARYVAVMRKRPHRMQAAEEVGVTWETVKRHLKQDPEFAAAVSEAEDMMIERVEAVLYDMALDENLGAVKEVLHNRAGHRWKDQQVLKHELSGPGGGPIMLAEAVKLGLVSAISDKALGPGVIDTLASFPTTEDLDAEYAEAEIVEEDDGEA